MSIRLSEERKLAWRAQAKAEGLDLSAFVVRAVEGEQVQVPREDVLAASVAAAREAVARDLDAFRLEVAAPDLAAFEERIRAWLRDEIREAEFRLADEFATRPPAPVVATSGLPPGYTPVGPGRPSAPTTPTWIAPRPFEAHCDQSEFHRVGSVCPECKGNGLTKGRAA